MPANSTKKDNIVDDLEHIVNGAEDLEWDANKIESPLYRELVKWSWSIQDQATKLYEKYQKTQEVKNDGQSNNKMG